MNQQQKEAFSSIMEHCKKFTHAAESIQTGSAEQFETYHEHLNAAADELHTLEQFCSADDPLLMQAQSLISRAKNLFQDAGIV